MYLCAQCMEAVMCLRPEEKRYAWFTARVRRCLWQSDDCAKQKNVLQYR